jgi:hypothetical protein
VAELSFAADYCPCEKLRTVLPLTVGIRDGAVRLVSIITQVGGMLLEGGRAQSAR